MSGYSNTLVGYQNISDSFISRVNRFLTFLFSPSTWQKKRKDMKDTRISKSMREISICVNQFIDQISKAENIEGELIGSETLENIINFIGQAILFDKKGGFLPIFLLDDNRKIRDRIPVFFFRRKAMEFEYIMELIFFSREELNISNNLENFEIASDLAKSIIFEKIHKKVLEKLLQRGIMFTEEELQVYYEGKPENSGTVKKL